MLRLRVRRWEMIRVVILPAALFCAIHLVATFLHWEKFTVESRPVVVWFASEVLPPPILFVAYFWQQRLARARVAVSSDGPFPRALRSRCLACGMALTVIGAIGFVLPTLFIPRFA